MKKIVLKSILLLIGFSFIVGGILSFIKLKRIEALNSELGVGGLGFSAIGWFLIVTGLIFLGIIFVISYPDKK